MAVDRPKENDPEIFIITPKRGQEEMLSRLAGLLQAIRGVHILGQGETCFKVEVAPDAVFPSALPKDVRHACFIEPAVSFDLASE
jgi:hypothetical protein